MLALEPGTVLALEPGIVLHSLPDQDYFFAFSVVSGDQFRLNQTSFWVLEAISKGAEWVRLRDSFVSAFEVSLEQGEADLRQLVDELHKERIIGRRDHEEDTNSL